MKSTLVLTRIRKQLKLTSLTKPWVCRHGEEQGMKLSRKLGVILVLSATLCALNAMASAGGVADFGPLQCRYGSGLLPSGSQTVTLQRTQGSLFLNGQSSGMQILFFPTESASTSLVRAWDERYFGHWLCDIPPR